MDYTELPNNNYNKTVIHIPTTLPIEKNIPTIIMADYLRLVLTINISRMSLGTY